MTTEDTKPVCKNCSRPLKRLEFPKCQYCGEVIPAEHRMSSEEARAEIRKRHAEWEKDKDSPMWGDRGKPKGASDFGWDIYPEISNRDGGDSGGTGGD